MEAIPPDHPDQPLLSNDLSVRFGYRYSQTNAFSDIEEGIKFASQSLQSFPLGHPNRALVLKNLASHLHERYKRTQWMEDLEKSIHRSRQAIDAISNSSPPNDEDLASCLNELGRTIGERYMRISTMADLEESIHTLQRAIEITSPGHPDRASLLSDLAIRLDTRSSRMEQLSDLDEAVNILREAVQSTPSGHQGRVIYLNTLANRLKHRHLRTGSEDDLDEAIVTLRNAIEDTASDQPIWAVLLNNLGNCLGSRHSLLGKLEDLEEAIVMNRKAFDLTPSGHFDRATSLESLGCLYAQRYSETGARSDLDEAIHLFRQALEARPPDCPVQATILLNIGVQLGYRYSLVGGLQDLDEAIKIMRQALEAISSDDSDQSERPRFLSSLGMCLGKRFHRTGKIADIEEAIDVARQAIEASPPGHPNRATLLQGLGARLMYRYGRTRAMEDLDEAISIAHLTIEATPPNHPDKAFYLSNFGVCLSDRFSETGSVKDIEMAIDVTREAIETTPENHPHRVMHFHNIGSHFLKKCLHATRATTDLEAAQKYLHLAVCHSTGITSERISAGQALISSPVVLSDIIEEAYSTSKATIDLIPLLSPRSLRHSDKRYLLSSIVGISCDAAAICLFAGKGPTIAVEFLETGRGVIADALFERSEIQGLREKYPDLEIALIDILERLDSPSYRGMSDIGSPLADKSLQESQVKLPKILQTIRSQIGFEKFLLPPSKTDILSAAEFGPIVIINVSHRCDALIIRKCDIQVLELPNLTITALNERARKIQSLETLEWLWDNVVKPILDHLGFTASPLADEWPHVWWIPTGILAQFPLHAAGHHLDCNGETAPDRVVSSYSSSIKAIIYSRQRGSEKPAAHAPLGVVAVSMQHTPNHEPLQFTSTKAKAVLSICEEMGFSALDHLPTKSSVLSSLKNCQIFHFAGHGSTSPADPLQSHLLLEDWETEPLNVESLLEISLGSNSPFLAYLSACGTGQLLDETSVDESIHLTSAYQLAGFRHVIGTLWSVDDNLSVHMARITYEYLRDKGISDESVRFGLHRATRLLRDEWIEGEIQAAKKRQRDLRLQRDAVLEDAELERKRPNWVPYVHYGS